MTTYYSYLSGGIAATNPRPFQLLGRRRSTDRQVIFNFMNRILHPPLPVFFSICNLAGCRTSVSANMKGEQTFHTLESIAHPFCMSSIFLQYHNGNFPTTEFRFAMSSLSAINP